MSGVLVDTSVWIDHFRYRNEVLSALLVSDAVMIHPMIVLELACGTPPAPRARTLDSLTSLRKVQQATQHEVLSLIEEEQLYGLGCGLVDMTLLASTRLTPETRLWTLDKRLAALADRLDILYRPALN